MLIYFKWYKNKTEIVAREREYFNFHSRSYSNVLEMIECIVSKIFQIAS